ncbi:MAG: type II toxin-antitoxin system mRNA interferase toxin, RelE/StbE family [Bacteroidetes bacterium]|nr:type II toxin-antitoxin system mRNA interferase toxin, RelE/StbE family [Bacteroidota bacterium]
MNIIWDNGFKRSYKKRIQQFPKLSKKFQATIKIFEENPFHSKLRTHKLSGELDDVWSFYVDYDCRVTFQFVDSHTVLLIDIGSHDEVY